MCVYLTCAHTDTRVYKAHAPVENPHFQTEEFKSRKDSLCDLEPASPLGVGLVRSVSLSRVRGKGRWLPVGQSLWDAGSTWPTSGVRAGPALTARTAPYPGPSPRPGHSGTAPAAHGSGTGARTLQLPATSPGNKCTAGGTAFGPPGGQRWQGRGLVPAGSLGPPSTLGGRRLPCSPLGHSLS